MCRNPLLPGWVDSRGRPYNRRDPLRLLDDHKTSTSTSSKPVHQHEQREVKQQQTSKKCISLADYKMLYGIKPSNRTTLNRAAPPSVVNIKPKLQQAKATTQSSSDTLTFDNIGDYLKSFNTNNDKLSFKRKSQEFEEEYKRHSSTIKKSRLM